MARPLGGLLIALPVCWSLIASSVRAEELAPVKTGGPSATMLTQAGRLLASGHVAAARQLVDRLAESGEGGSQRDFLDGMISYSARDYRRAEAMFRRILDRDPRLLRVRLELARTLYMANRDEEAEYHFRLAAAGHPPAQVMRNITNFRNAIRARRSWRFNIDFGFAPDSNINSATDKEMVDIQGLPFRLDRSARARSGTGRFVGGDASIRLNRSGKVPIYVEGHGRYTSYDDRRFDDAYAGFATGPELAVAGGQLRTTATGLIRWYGNRRLVSSFGARVDYEKLVGNRWNVGGTLLVRRNDYARRSDVDGWDVQARASASRPLGLTSLGFASAAIERSHASDRGHTYWRGRIGVGILKEIGWGLRPQLRMDLARQLNDGPLSPFGEQRRDWRLESSFSIYKRDWNVQGFAPSLTATLTRNYSTLPLYDERRLRAEARLTRAF
ncbi:MAG TPA: porin family protein [Sphingomicrobium sp.]|nr:porin family protein [Sphingomicrobium sp.]